MFNIPTNALKSLDQLLQHFKEETIDEVESSFKSLKKNFKAGNYLAISTLFILTGASMVSSQAFDGQFFIQALIYFSFALFALLSFGIIVWKILK